MAEKKVKFGPEIPGQFYVAYEKDSEPQEWEGTLAFAVDRQSLCFAANGESFNFSLDRIDPELREEVVHGVAGGKLIGVLFEDNNGFVEHSVADEGAEILTSPDTGWKTLLVGPPGKKGYVTSSHYPAKRYTICIPESGTAVGVEVEVLEDKFVEFEGLHDICLDGTLHPEPIVMPFKVFDGGHNDFWFRCGKDSELDFLLKSALPILADFKQGKRCIITIFANEHYCYKCEKGNKEQIVLTWGNEWPARSETYFDDGDPSDGLVVIAKPSETLLLYFVDQNLGDRRCLELIFAEDGKSVSGRELVISEGGA